MKSFRTTETPIAWTRFNFLVAAGPRRQQPHFRSVMEIRKKRSSQSGMTCPARRISGFFADREGSLWIGTNGGLARWFSGKFQRFPVTDPLASASVLALMEDREGDLWVGTEADGLHILRDQRFRAVGAHEGLSSDATRGCGRWLRHALGGNQWCWTEFDAAGYNWTSGRFGSECGARLFRSQRTDERCNPLSGLRGKRRSLMGTPDGLNRVRGGVIASFTSADGLPDDFIRSLLVIRMEACGWERGTDSHTGQWAKSPLPGGGLQNLRWRLSRRPMAWEAIS